MKKRSEKKVLLTYNENPAMSFLLHMFVGGREDSVHGIAHFVEHMMATAYRDDEKMLDDVITASGMGINAGTTIHWTQYGLRDNISTIYDLDDMLCLIRLFSLRLSRMMSGDITEDELNREKAIVINEIKIQSERKKILKDMTFHIKEGLPFNGTIGTEESVSSITAKDIQEFLQKNYKVKNAFVDLSVPSDISEDDLEKIMFEINNNLLAVMVDDGENYSYEELQKRMTVPMKPGDMLYDKHDFDSLSVMVDMDTNLEDAEILNTYLDDWAFKHLREELRLGYVAKFSKAISSGPNKYQFFITADRSQFPLIKEEITKKLKNLSSDLDYAEQKKNTIKNIRKVFEILSSKNPSSSMMTTLLTIVENARYFSHFYNRYASDLITEENRQKYNKPYDVFLGWLENTPDNDLARIGRGWKSIDQIGEEMLASIQYIETNAKDKKGDDVEDVK